MFLFEEQARNTETGREMEDTMDIVSGTAAAAVPIFWRLFAFHLSIAVRSAIS